MIPRFHRAVSDSDRRSAECQGSSAFCRLEIFWSTSSSVVGMALAKSEILYLPNTCSAAVINMGKRAPGSPFFVAGNVARHRHATVAGFENVVEHLIVARHNLAAVQNA